MERVPFLVETLEKTRVYTNSILDRIPQSDWFRQPQGGVTHVAWQVGHLTIAQYFLGLERIRGKREADQELIEEEILIQFSRTSIPDPDPANNPSPDKLREVYDRVHNQVIQETKTLDDKVLDELGDKPHPIFKDKFGALWWCSQHEFNHAGQLSLINRLLGNHFHW